MTSALFLACLTWNTQGIIKIANTFYATQMAVILDVFNLWLNVKHNP